MTNTQPKSKILIVVICILLVANIVLLSFFLLSRKEDKRPERINPMNAYLEKEIGFTKEQLVQFDTIQSRHRREVKKVFDEVRANKGKVFREVGLAHFDDSAINKAAAYSSSRQMNLEAGMLKHLKEIRNICTPVQKEKFDTGFYKQFLRPKGDDRNHD